MTQAWLDAGFRSEQVDMTRRRLVFRRAHQATAAGQSRDSSDSQNHPVVGWMKDTVTIAPDADLTTPADPGWAGLVPGRVGALGDE